MAETPTTPETPLLEQKGLFSKFRDLTEEGLRALKAPQAKSKIRQALDAAVTNAEIAKGDKEDELADLLKAQMANPREFDIEAILTIEDKISAQDDNIKDIERWREKLLG